jgi:hypothetical protein
MDARTTRGRSRLALAAFVAALAASASPATAAVTIGQVAPVTPPVDCAGVDVDLTQPTVTSGTGYVVPAIPPARALVISAWRHNAAVGEGQMLTLKVFRKIADPATYQAVGHDGPRPLTAANLNTFETGIPVEPGDVLGVNSAVPSQTACSFSAPGETRLVRIGNLADGESGDFSANADGRRTNVSAVVEPSNVFTLGAAQLNRRKGTAKIPVSLPNPGELVLSGKGLKNAGTAFATTVTEPDDVSIRIKAKGKKKRKLNRKLKVNVRPEFTYTPTGGDPSSESTKVTLKKRPLGCAGGCPRLSGGA